MSVDSSARPETAAISSCTAIAPAKINLHLGVGPLREDGFHDLVTIYQAVDMWARVTVWDDPSARGWSLTATGPGAEQVPRDETNLAYRAVQDCCAAAGRTIPAVGIHLAKQIPVAGGMAGGSADAAAAMVAANELYALHLSASTLLEIAAGLGSDVPFCLKGGTVLGTGRGEQLTPMPAAHTRLHWAVATMREGLATPAVFAELDTMRSGGLAPASPSFTDDGHADDHGHSALARALRTGDVASIASHLSNDLQPPAVRLRPALRDTLAAGRDAGALAGLVSGSGPSCLFLCADAESALDVATEIAARGKADAVYTTSGPTVGAHVVEYH